MSVQLNRNCSLLQNRHFSRVNLLHDYYLLDSWSWSSPMHKTTLLDLSRWSVVWSIYIQYNFITWFYIWLVIKWLYLRNNWLAKYDLVRTLLFKSKFGPFVSKFRLSSTNIDIFYFGCLSKKNYMKKVSHKLSIFRLCSDFYFWYLFALVVYAFVSFLESLE